MTQTTYVQGTVVQPAWLNDVDTATYKASSSITGAVTRTAISKFSDVVTPQDFGAVGDGTTDDTAAIQAAINSGVKRLYFKSVHKITSTLTCLANQQLRFEGGSLLCAVGTYTNGALYLNTIANVKIVDPIIDASATTGIIGINCIDAIGAHIQDGLFTKCNLQLSGTNINTRLGYKVSGLTLNMSSYLVTGIYISGAKSVSISDCEVFNGLEGSGIYNGSTYVKYTNCESYGHTQDGFVIINGQRISYTGCQSHNNGQSGYDVQRQTAATNANNISFSSCHSYDNTFDGFDLRGANTTPWNSDIRITCTGCVSTGNTGTGFYVVNAEGTALTGCMAALNNLPGFFIDHSARVTLSSCESISNATGASAGTGKAGILFAVSPNGSAVGCISSNSSGATQTYGISFTGASTSCSVAGGDYNNNSTAPYNIDGTATVAVTGLAQAVVGATNVWLNYLNSATGMGDYTGFGGPTFTAVKGSVFHRTDGGSGEIYISNGGTSWTIR